MTLTDPMNCTHSLEIEYLKMQNGGQPPLARRWLAMEVASSTQAVPLPGNDLRRVVHTHVPLSPSSIG